MQIKEKMDVLVEGLTVKNMHKRLKKLYVM